MDSKAETNEQLKSALNDLKDARKQLIRQEKLATLGQLTAGIAHEIKNPLNFITNFSELSIELLDEVREALNGQLNPEARQTSGDTAGSESVFDILDDIKANLEKIHEHGSRADSIVKSMLQHSKGGSGEREPTNLNELIEEYVNLAFHGMRARPKPINVDIRLNLDDTLDDVPLIAGDFSRVILNLCNNAFDAMRTVICDPEKWPVKGGSYTACLTAETRKQDRDILVKITDNGPGIPEENREKVLQPFFTTKKGTEGTGLGLSITHDIIKAHGGTMNIESAPGRGTTITILLPPT